VQLQEKKQRSNNRDGIAEMAMEVDSQHCIGGRWQLQMQEYREAVQGGSAAGSVSVQMQRRVSAAVQRGSAKYQCREA
jgi:hypothetical protein